jgi:6-phosphogluconate dehydrogenase
LHDDRRADHEVQRLDPIFKIACAGRGLYFANPRPQGRTCDSRIRVSPLWSEWRRPFCQNGPQRHRIRHHGRLCGGTDILRGANIGKQTHAIDAETTPLSNPDHYKYDINLPDVAEVWRARQRDRLGRST